MLKRFFILLAIFITAVNMAVAYDVSPEEALKAAETHIIISKTESRLTDHIEIYKDNDANTIGYLFLLEPQGYIAVSPDKRLRPVIAYSFDNDCSTDIDAKGLVWMFTNDMRFRLAEIDQFTYNQVTPNLSLWDEYLICSAALIEEFYDISQYGPWTDTEWDQSSPYNDLCPIDPVTGERCPAGCVITAVAQILNYWEYPTAFPLTAADSYYSEGTSPSIFIDAETANVDFMEYNAPNSIHPSDEMVAKLMWATGVSLRATYADEGTMASFEPEILLSRWGYIYAEDFYSTTAWGFDSTFNSNAIQGKVMYMSLHGHPEADGHAIVIDGYKNSGEYRVNMGWGGYEDGWYFLPTDLPYGYTIVAKVMMNITGQPEFEMFTDNCLNARELIFSDSYQSYSGSFYPNGDVDWFMFHMNSDSCYEFKTTGPHDITMEIYDSCDGEPLHTITDGGSENNVYFWLTPDIEAEGMYYIKLSSSSDIHDTKYKLQYRLQRGVTRPYITLSLPAGGATLIGGENAFIFFSKGGIPAIEYVQIDYSISGTDGPWIPIVDSLTTGMYSWTVPLYEDDYRNCYIRISDQLNGYAQTMNTIPFSIRNPAAVKENLLPEDLSVKVFPNPFNSSVNISLPNNFSEPIDIIDINGYLIKKLRSHDNHTTWDGTDENGNTVNSGIYLLRIKDKNKDLLLRLIYIK